MLLLFSLLFNTPPLQTNLDSFKHFKKDGNKEYCLVDYQAKEIHCIYESMDDCRNQYDKTPDATCFPRKTLKLEDAQ